MRTLAVISAVVALGLVACKQQPRYRDAAPRPPPGGLRGTFALTYYWVSAEADAEPAAADTTIFDKDCTPLATLATAYADELALAGAGKLADGRMLGVAGECSCKRSPCYRVIDHPWGIGAHNRPLEPFRSLAVDREVIPIGTALWIQELDGIETPGTFPTIHDGCVVADDVGGKITGQRIDWFVARKPYYRELDRAHELTQVHVFDGGARCASYASDAGN